MITWVLYDIAEDRARTRIAKHCKQAGLHRVQYSVFVGTIDANQKDTLALEIEQVMDATRDKVYIFPMGKSALQASVLMGQAFDKKLISNEVKALFF